ncbi:MAG: hypothetical protein N4A35_06140 [Flavobacteriales bacterium]|jgi:hypothetical protein|nr:hypothetical protein [Flavobacteriales bacterium]
MKNLIYILLLSACTTSVFAQIPGYLGKRISVEGDLNLMPSFNFGNSPRPYFSSKNEIDYVYNPNTNTNEPITVAKYNRDDIPVRNNLRWFFKPSLAVNFTLSRKMDLSLRFNKIYGNLMYDIHRYNGLDNTIFFKENLKYRSSEIDLNFKFYNRNFIAPVGKYLLLGIGYSKVNLKESTGTLLNLTGYYNDIGMEDAEKEVTVNYSATYLKFILGIGNKIMLKERLYLMYTLECNYYHYMNNDSSDTDGFFIYRFRENISQSLSTNLRNSNMFSAKLGIGIML